MDAITILTEGTMKAACLMVHKTNKFPKLQAESRINPDRYYALVSGALRQCLKTGLQGIMKEWKDAIDAHIGEGMLGTIINTQCNYQALEALKMVEEEL